MADFDLFDVIKKSGGKEFTFSEAVKWLAVRDPRKTGAILSKLKLVG